MNNYCKHILLLCFFAILSFPIFSKELKIAVLKFGSVNWELDVLEHHGLNKQFQLNLKRVQMTNKDAAAIAFLSGSVDIFVTDWIWVSKQRYNGSKVSFLPYSTAAGGLIIKNNSERKKLQELSIKNFYLTHVYISNLIDNYRDEKLKIKKFFTKKSNINLRILHITNFNERLDGRLFFNTGRRINNGFIRQGHSVLGFSDRDIQRYYKSYKDFKGAKTLNDKLKKTCYNYKPDLIVLGHADLISADQLLELRKDYPNTKFAQWFLDPLNKNGPDFERNKERILDKINVVDTTFLTTSPEVLNFLQNKRSFFIPNPCDKSFETLENYNRPCNVDVFFALSHGVHRGVLKSGKIDDRVKFLSKLVEKTPNVKFDIYGIDKVQPIWADHYFKTINNAKMGLNLSRGEAIKYYSSDRITQIIGNGLVCLIDEKTEYQNFFNNNEMVFYKSLSDLSEKIIKISADEKLRKKIGRNGKKKYMKYFNSDLVSEYIISKTLDLRRNKQNLWEK